MTRSTALLVLGAILLIVMGLVGQGGTVANVAAMDKSKLAAAINEQSVQTVQQGASTGMLSEPADTPEIVNPVVMDSPEGGFDEEPMDPPAAELNTEHTAESDGITAGAFDPRIG